MTDDFSEKTDSMRQSAPKADETAPKKASIERLANGHFRPGRSANPEGRPPKRERSFLPRQLTRDILSITEEPITVNTADGPKTYTAIELALLKMRKRAMEGHGPSLNRLLKMHEQALKDHYERHSEKFSSLEDLEMNAIFQGTPLHHLSLKWLNGLRKLTRKS